MVQADSRPHGGIAELRWLIQQTAAGAVPVDELIASFRTVYEGDDRHQYRSKEEARLIWDVLWALEFYSPDPNGERDPSEWNDAPAVLATVQEAARRLSQL